MVDSYIWRATTDVDADGLGQRTQASGVEVIQFTAVNITDGKHIHRNELNFEVGFAENDRPKQQFNQLQDTGPKSLTFSVIGAIETPNSNDTQQTVKEWLIEDKMSAPYTKGRFGIELANFSTAYDVTPATTGTTSPTRVEQARGLVLTNWEWIQDGNTLGKLDFIATFRFNGDEGNTTTTVNYDWTVIHTT